MAMMRYLFDDCSLGWVGALYSSDVVHTQEAAGVQMRPAHTLLVHPPTHGQHTGKVNPLRTACC